MANSQANRNITRSFVGEGPLANTFQASNATSRGPGTRCISLVDPFALVIGIFKLTNANRGNAQVGNGPLGDLIRHAL